METNEKRNAYLDLTMLFFEEKEMSEVEKRIVFLKEFIDKPGMYFTTQEFEGEYFIFRRIKSFVPMIKISKDVDISEAISRLYTKEENLDKGIIDLYKNTSIEALFSLIEEDKYRYFAIRFFSEFHKNVLANYLERIWEVVQKYSINNPELLLTIFEIEGRDSKTIPILQDMNCSMMLHPDLKEQFEELLLQHKIEDELTKLRSELDTVGRKELTNSLNTIEADFEERIRLIASGWEKKHTDLLKQIREHDTTITEDRKEGLQKQIDITQKDLDRVQANTRLFLIFISIIFTLIAGAYLGLSGWLISLLVKLISS